MQITSARMTCKKCTHVFDAEVVTSAPIEVWQASVRAIRCPQCGGAEMLFCGEKNGASGIVTLSISVRAEWWRDNGSVGISSKTIWSVLHGRAVRHSVDVPHDPDDFGRCHRLLELIPEWVPRLPEVSAKYPAWTKLIAAWPEMERLYVEELPSGKCPKLYALMQELRK